MRRSGSTLIELLAGLAITGIVFGGIFTVVMGLSGAQRFSVNMPTVQQQARQIATTVAGAIRRATLCASTDSGCTLDAAVQGTSATGVTVYTRNGSNTLVPVTYSVANGSFQRTVGNGQPVVLCEGATMTLTYYQSSRYHLNAGAGLVSYIPTSGSTPSLIAVKVQTTVNSNGLSATYSTLVRLRGGPKKLFPSD